MHDNIKNYKCDLCEYTGSRNDHLKRHQHDIHYKIKLHSHDKCEYTASQKGTLNQYNKTAHDDTKTYLGNHSLYGRQERSFESTSEGYPS